MALPRRQDYGSSIDVQGLSELRKGLKALDRDANRNLSRGLRNAARPVLAEARALAPRSNVHSVGYRHLADTLRIRVGANGSVGIGSNKPNARLIHFGQGRTGTFRHPLFGDRDHWYTQRAQPFISRAIEHQQANIVNSVGDAIEAAARRQGWTRP